MVDYTSQISKIEAGFIFSLFSGIVVSLFCVFLVYIFLTRDLNSFSTLNFSESTQLVLRPIVTIILVLVAIFSIKSTYKYCRDIPNVLKRAYIEDTCTIVGQDAGGTATESRSVQVKCSKSGDEFTFLTQYLPMKIGDVYRIIYLPNTKFGSVIEKIN